ncbi:MAG: nuclear transport factor 2 family protein [Thermodesulfobacteriota bacterium]
MKKLILITMIFGWVVLLTTEAEAGDVEDIRKATLEHFVTFNAGNVAAHIEHHLQGHTGYSPDGGLLEVNESLEEEKMSLQADFDAGLKFDLQIQHLDVKVYGNAAVVTGYLVGTVTNTDGTTSQVRDRRTAVLIKKGKKWKEVHTHISPIMTAE